jgi:peptidoglycan/xylan/chitin deacetylase (PgdA/CDA1 family)
VTASFGILGQWAEANPDLVRRMVDEGHMLFNHSWSHASLTGATTGTAPLTNAELLQELEQTERVVAEITGGYQMQPYFRPPYGDYDASSLASLAQSGYSMALLWSCDSRDSLGATAEEILSTCIDTAQPGRIVLLHVGAQSAAYEALPRIIAALREQGFSFVTAEEILRP